MAKLSAIPIEIKHANKVVSKYHRHCAPVVFAKFAIGGIDENDNLFGVAIVGRPVTIMLDDGYTAEVLRVCCLPDGPKGSNSFLYARCWRAWKAMGGRRMITYTLKSETGASLRGAGWLPFDASSPKQWNGTRKRQIRDIYDLEKVRWEKVSGEACPILHPKNYRLFRDLSGRQLAMFDDDGGYYD